MVVVPPSAILLAFLIVMSEISLFFIRVVAWAFQKYAWRISLRRIHVLGVVE